MKGRMPRMVRVAPADVVFHVLNRGNGRAHIFDDDGDYRAFLRILADTQAVVPMRLLAYFWTRERVRLSGRTTDGDSWSESRLFPLQLYQ